MSVRGVIQYSKFPGFGREQVREALSEGNAAAVEHWHEEFAPDHFEEDATRRYGYQKRAGSGEPPRVTRNIPGGGTRTVDNPKYIWQKRRRFGHTKPLVWSGKSAAAAKTIRITGSPTRGEGAFTALPKYFFQRRKDLKQPDKAAELVTVLEAEVVDMAAVAEHAAAAVLNRAGTTKTVTA